ncbi:hypothetical protein D8M05_04515 [Oceanobacillus bengalensis]|uniref:Uncharacterized protein n=1 Tax=Oceanobacillus bengalensis TaxID=1435466 RepID=A0A494Z474_9BACI|nr:hypothetical protein D8M05_04515 [Oceanobacillus bengalensis]
MKPSIKSLKRYFIGNIILFTFLTIVYYINYQSNDSSVLTLENFTLVIGITLLLVSTLSYISMKIYEKKRNKKNRDKKAIYF